MVAFFKGTGYFIAAALILTVLGGLVAFLATVSVVIGVLGFVYLAIRIGSFILQACVEGSPEDPSSP